MIINPGAGTGSAGSRWSRPAPRSPHRRIGRGDERAPRAPVRAHLSLLPSGPGEVHEMDAAREATPDYPTVAGSRRRRHRSPDGTR